MLLPLFEIVECCCFAAKSIVRFVVAFVAFRPLVRRVYGEINMGAKGGVSSSSEARLQLDNAFLFRVFVRSSSADVALSCPVVSPSCYGDGHGHVLVPATVCFSQAQRPTYLPTWHSTRVRLSSLLTLQGEWE